MKKFFKTYHHDTENIKITKREIEPEPKSSFSRVYPPTPTSKLEKLPYIKVRRKECDRINIDI